MNNSCTSKMHGSKLWGIISQLLRFMVTGAVAVAIHYGTYLILRKWTTDSIAYIIGYGVSFACNYLLTCMFTFKKSSTAYRGVGFCMAHTVNFCLQIGLLKFYLRLNVDPRLAPLFIFCITVPINFLLVRYAFIHKEQIKQ